MLDIADGELADVETALAHQVEDVLVLRIAGTAPTGCHVVSLDRSLLDVEPPTFTASWWLPPNVRCREGRAPYEHQAAFRVGTARPEVHLHHAGGRLSVAVEVLTPVAAAAVPDRDGGPLDGLGGPPEEAVGRSRDYDLREAIHDAVGQLPPRGAGIPDWLSTYEVVEIGAQIGGIGGFDHLTVRVRG